MSFHDTIGNLLDIDLKRLDPGVSVIAEYNPNNGMISVMVSNCGDNVWAMMRNVRKNDDKS